MLNKGGLVHVKAGNFNFKTLNGFCRVNHIYLNKTLACMQARHGLPIYNYHTYAASNAGHFSYHKLTWDCYKTEFAFLLCSYYSYVFMHIIQW